MTDLNLWLMLLGVAFVVFGFVMGYWAGYWEGRKTALRDIGEYFRKFSKSGV